MRARGDRERVAELFGLLACRAAFYMVGEFLKLWDDANRMMRRLRLSRAAREIAWSALRESCRAHGNTTCTPETRPEHYAEIYALAELIVVERGAAELAAILASQSIDDSDIDQWHVYIDTVPGFTQSERDLVSRAYARSTNAIGDGDWREIYAEAEALLRDGVA